MLSVLFGPSPAGTIPSLANLRLDSDHMIAALAWFTYNLPTCIKRDTATKGDDAARRVSDAAVLFEKARVKRIGIILPIK